MFREKMKTPAIPERVYTLCKIVEKKPLTVQELKNKMEPDYLQQSTSYFADYREAAEELGLISVTDQNVELAADPSAVRSMADMRRYVNGRLEEFADGQFYRVTKAYYARGANVLHGSRMSRALRLRLNKNLACRSMPRRCAPGVFGSLIWDWAICMICLSFPMPRTFCMI